MITKEIQKKSFGCGIDPSGENKFVWVNSGSEMDAMIHLFSAGWQKVDFVFEDCEIIQ